jgi:hypothetical protein
MSSNFTKSQLLTMMRLTTSSLEHEVNYGTNSALQVPVTAWISSRKISITRSK